MSYEEIKTALEKIRDHAHNGYELLEEGLPADAQFVLIQQLANELLQDLRENG